jgi:hypothetical protein
MPMNSTAVVPAAWQAVPPPVTKAPHTPQSNGNGHADMNDDIPF